MREHASGLSYMPRPTRPIWFEAKRDKKARITRRDLFLKGATILFASLGGAGTVKVFITDIPPSPFDPKPKESGNLVPVAPLASLSESLPTEIITVPFYIQDKISALKKEFAIFNTDLSDIQLPLDDTDIMTDPNRREIEFPMAIVNGIVNAIDIHDDPKIVQAYANYASWIDTWLRKEANIEALDKSINAYNPYSYLSQNWYGDEEAALQGKLMSVSGLFGAVLTTWKVFPEGLIDRFRDMPSEYSMGPLGNGAIFDPREKTLTRNITYESYKFAQALGGSLPAGSASEQLKTVFPRLFDIRVNMGFSFS